MTQAARNQTIEPVDEVAHDETDVLVGWDYFSNVTRIKSKSAALEREKRGDVPKRVYLSRNCVRWWKSELDHWLNTRPRTIEEFRQREEMMSERGAAA